jgi:hypothetical protein
MKLNFILADMVYYIHLTFVIIMVIAPYSRLKILHNFYYVMVPTLFIRWVTNYSKCSVTTIESKLRGIQEEDGFIYKIITPIYNFKCEKRFNIILYLYMLTTWISIK